MKKMNRSFITALLVLLVWGALVLGAWFAPGKDISEAERRPLAQFPQISGQNVLSGKFMTDFESYTLDQFPLRDGFRSVKAVFHRYILGQKDNNDIYLFQGYAAQQMYPLNIDSVNHALNRFNTIYENLLAPGSCRVYMAIVPDKGYYLAEPSGHLSADYGEMFRLFREGMPWATHIDLTGVLSLESYYRTDTHWRQEALLPGAQLLCNAMGVRSFPAESFTNQTVQETFYGVYYGQAALPMAPDSLTILRNDILDGCQVYDYESGNFLPIYNLEKLQGKDPYDVYLSGSRSLLTIENPNAGTDRELIVFRDSFGSSMIPLLVRDYAKVTLVDIRYIQSGMLSRFLTFQGQDVLFLYSTLVLNNSQTIK